MVSGDNFSHVRSEFARKILLRRLCYETWYIALNNNLFFFTSLCSSNLYCLSLDCLRRETLFRALNLKGLYCEANDPIAKPKCKSNQKMPIASFASLPWPCAIKDITQELWKVHWWEDENTTKCKPPKTKALRTSILPQSLTLLIG